MRQVTRTEFFEKIGPMDVHPTLSATFPYTAWWRERHTGRIIGKSIDDSSPTVVSNRYFLID